MSRARLFPLILIFSLAVSPAYCEEKAADALGTEDAKTVDAILEKLKITVDYKRNEGSLPVLSYEEFYLPLDDAERKFLKDLQALSPETLGIKTPFLGIPQNTPDLVKIENQPVMKAGKPLPIGTQYLPRKVYEQYELMMKAMEKELGRRLYVESGYRSPAYQLYLFVFYLVQHKYSVRETAQWNAFPGYSEHGYPDKQAIDFISQDGVSGEENPALFEKLAEYGWLVKHAAEYHFRLSYPKDNPIGIGFEPWHWRYDETQKTRKNQS